MFIVKENNFWYFIHLLQVFTVCLDPTGCGALFPVVDDELEVDQTHSQAVSCWRLLLVLMSIKHTPEFKNLVQKIMTYYTLAIFLLVILIFLTEWVTKYFINYTFVFLNSFFLKKNFFPI